MEDTSNIHEIKKRKVDVEVYTPKKPMPKSLFHIIWTCRTEIVDSGCYRNLPDSYCFNHYGKLMFVPIRDGIVSDEKEIELEIGNIKCIKISNPKIIDDGLNRLDYLDSKTRELYVVAQLLEALDGEEEVRHASIYNKLYPPGGPRIKVSLINDVGDGDEIMQGSVLYIERIEIKEEFRGLGLGLFLVDQADSVLNNHMSLCLLNPYPLQYLEDDMDPESSGFKISQNKIKKLWQLLGFKSIKHGDVEYMGRWNGYVVPFIKTICPHLFV
jgi:hypothetical protein